MQHEEENIRKRLEGKKPQDGFKLPANYFDTFSTQVKNRIEAQHPIASPPLWQRLLRPVFVVPATLVVVVTAAYFGFFYNNSTQVADNNRTIDKKVTIDDLSTESISEYLAQDVSLIGIDSEVEKEFVLMAYENTAINETTSLDKSEIPAFTNKKNDTITLTDEEIENYLLDTDDNFLYENL